MNSVHVVGGSIHDPGLTYRPPPSLWFTGGGDPEMCMDPGDLVPTNESL